MTQRVYEFPNGIKFEGQINIDGLPDGRGKITYPDGTNYEGEWLKGKKHGKGKQMFAAQEHYEGNWKDNMKDGEGTYVFANGDQYIGCYKNDLREGRGTYYHANGINYEGNWEKGMTVPMKKFDLGDIDSLHLVCIPVSARFGSSD
jgi:hypothetical protein